MPPATKKSSYEEGSLDQYLRDISIYPLISREEEVRLAQKIRVNDQEALLAKWKRGATRRKRRSRAEGFSVDYF